MNKMQKLALVPAILIALLGTASFTVVIANWSKIFSDDSQENVTAVKPELKEENLEKFQSNNQQNSPVKETKKVEALKPVKVKKAPKIIKSLIAGGVKIDFLGCEKNYQINCQLILTATHRDTRFHTHIPSNRIIVNGEEFKGTSGAVGRYFNSRGFEVNLVRQIPMKASINFPLIEEAEKIDLMEINTYSSIATPRLHKFQIRDISL